tara:strand:+ start:66 stop:467 length:402 start_codon:yes stop_codon:yes gene_type:complete
MATITAAITLTSTDLLTDSLSLSTTATLTKAGTATGLDQTTGLARKYYATAVTNETLIAAGSYTDNKSHKLYIKNLATDDTQYVQLTLAGSNETLGRLYAGDWAFIPYMGTNDLDITTSDNAMTVEYALFYEA